MQLAIHKFVIITSLFFHHVVIIRFQHVHYCTEINIIFSITNTTELALLQHQNNGDYDYINAHELDSYHITVPNKVLKLNTAARYTTNLIHNDYSLLT